jgi:hypothetical protein
MTSKKGQTLTTGEVGGTGNREGWGGIERENGWVLRQVEGSLDSGERYK